MEWVQVYDPLGWPLVSALVAALPIVLLLGLLVCGLSAPQAAAVGLASALAVPAGALRSPTDLSWAGINSSILSYDVLDERREGEFFKIRIRAVVRREPAGAPGSGAKVAVSVDARGCSDRKAAERGVRRALREAGLTPAFGRVDFVVSGEAEVMVQDGYELEGFASSRARLSVELRDPAAGELLASRSVEAAAIDPSRQGAAAKALELAGRLAGQAIARDLAARR